MKTLLKMVKLWNLGKLEAIKNNLSWLVHPCFPDRKGNVLRRKRTLMVSIRESCMNQGCCLCTFDILPRRPRSRCIDQVILDHSRDPFVPAS